MSGVYTKILRACLVTISLFLSFGVSSQIYTYRTYTEDDGLSQSFINDIIQDDRGYLYLATGNGLTIFDGNNIRVLTTKDSLTNNFVTSIYSDHEDKTWLGHLEGGVSVINTDGKVEKVKFKEEIASKIIQIIEISTNYYVFLKNNTGIILYNESSKEYVNIEDDNFSGITRVITLKDEMWFVKPDGVYSMKVRDLLKQKYTITKRLNLPEAIIIRLNVPRNNLIVVDNKLGVLTFKIDANLTPLDTFHINKSETSIYTRLAPDRFGNYYVATSENGYYKIESEKKLVSNFTTANGLSSNAIQSLLIDRENNLWVGTYGNGLQQLNNELYCYNIVTDLGQKLAVNSTYKLHRKLLMATSKGIGFFENDKITFAAFPNLLNKNVNCLNYYRHNFIFSTSDGELFQADTLLKKLTKIPIKTNNQKLTINSITFDRDNLLICTTSGLYVVDPVSFKYTLYNTDSGWLHNNIRFVYRDSKQHLWVCSPGTLIYYIDDFKDIKKFDDVPGLRNFSTNSVCEDLDQNVWISSIGDGVFKYDGRRFDNYTVSNGLKSNFCYGVSSDFKGGIWVSHSNGISYKNKNKKNFNKIESTTNLLQNLFIENSIFYDKEENDITFGMSSGIVRINTTKQRFNEIEPALSFSKITLNDKLIPPFSDTTLEYHSYNLVIDYIGICFTESEKVKYKYKLEGLTDNWEIVTYETRKVIFPKLKDGEYTFLLQAANNDGLWTSKPISFKITIKAPFWKEIWFYILLAIVIGLIVYWVIKRRTKILLQKQKELEEIITQKTVEIQQEKENIAKVNEEMSVVLKDLRDSINYAKKIQTFILPPLNYTQKHLKTFLYFEPRDVVSGDYYGYYNFDKDKTIVFLIDCTGHGVPGAFLTVISKAFLNKIILDKEIYEPDAIIEHLNFELRSFFDSNPDTPQKNFEGLVMAVCCIDYPTKTVQFCGAGRPCMFKIGNELTLQKGNISSVGYDEDLPGLEVINLSFEKDLRIYLFSDGLQDQFGGPKGKKYSMNRVKETVEKCVDMSFDDECQLLISEFKEWKGDHPQVDDICFFAFELYSYA